MPYLSWGLETGTAWLAIQEVSHCRSLGKVQHTDITCSRLGNRDQTLASDLLLFSTAHNISPFAFHHFMSERSLVWSGYLSHSSRASWTVLRLWMLFSDRYHYRTKIGQALSRPDRRLNSGLGLIGSIPGFSTIHHKEKTCRRLARLCRTPGGTHQRASSSSQVIDHTCSGRPRQ